MHVVEVDEVGGGVGGSGSGSSEMLYSIVLSCIILYYMISGSVVCILSW